MAAGSVCDPVGEESAWSGQPGGGSSRKADGKAEPRPAAGCVALHGREVVNPLRDIETWQSSASLSGSPGGAEPPTKVACYRFFVRFRVLIEQDEDGVFVATCPSLPGCVSQGRTRAEAAASIRDAIEGYVASLKKHGEPIPPSIDEDVVEVAV